MNYEMIGRNMGCVFCENQQDRYYLYNGRKMCRMISEDEYWTIFPTIGAFVEGYVLHVLKRHATASALCTMDEISRLKRNVLDLAQKYQSVYHCQFSYIFEHGSIDAAYEASCCINHTHVHMLPTTKDIDSVLSRVYLNEALVFECLDDAYQSVLQREMRSYILVGGIHSSKYWVLDTTENVRPSQYMRQVMYSLLVGDPNTYQWDWRRFPYLDNVFNTAKHMNVQM